MNKTKFALLMAASALTTLSGNALANDCGSETIVERTFSHTEYVWYCSPRDRLIRTSNAVAPLCPDRSYATLAGESDIYTTVVDAAPTATWRETSVDSRNGYAYTKLTSTSRDDNGIASLEWYVDGDLQDSGSNLYLEADKPSYYSGGVTTYHVELRVTDSIGQVCSKKRNVSVRGPTCGTRDSNYGCH